jgi:hypothetical protein
MVVGIFVGLLLGGKVGAWTICLGYGLIVS